MADTRVGLLSDEKSLFKMMQGLTLCYTQFYNRKYGMTGRLWENRYHSCIVDQERYLWAVARYIEQNPVRARIVRKAERYPYSSARAHVTGAEDVVLGETLFEEEQRDDYIRMLRTETVEEEKEVLRYHSRSGRPFGEKEFVQGIEQKLKRPLARRPRGRPKKNNAL
jgi:putative transposase